MSPVRALRRLVGDDRGSTLIEFGLLAPAFIVMLFGVLQVGIGLQNYNAMRSLSADVARHAMIEHARDNPLSNTQLEAYAADLGSGAPYLLIGDNLDVDVAPAATQQIDDASELTLTIEYQIPSVLSSLGLEGPEIDYRRPIFLADD